MDWSGLSIKQNTIYGAIVAQLSRDPGGYIWPSSVAGWLGVTSYEVKEVLEVFVKESRIEKAYNYTCEKCDCLIHQTAKPIKKIRCPYCDKIRSVERETLSQQVVYKGKINAKQGSETC